MDINVNKLYFSQKIDELDISDKTKSLLRASGILTLKDLVLSITRKLVERPGISMKDATIECLMDVRRFGRDNALELMEELRKIDFFEEIDWELELNERVKEQKREQEEKETRDNIAMKSKARLAKEI